MPDLNIGIALTPIVPVVKATALAPVVPVVPVVPPTPFVNLTVAASVATLNAGIGSASSFTLTFSNAGAQSADAAVLTAAWLQNSANRSFASIVVTSSVGVVLGAFANSNLQAGAVVTTWPSGGSITVAVQLTALLPFVESLVSTAVPSSGVLESAPANNTAVITVHGAAASASVKWQDFVTPTNLAASITTGVKDRGGGTIGFCGDNFAQAKIFGVFSTPDVCPPTSTCTGARWQIAIIGYDAAKTYTVTQDYSALSPPPATYAETFVVTQSGALLTLTTDYTLLGETVADGIASAGNALFTVLENGVSIGTVTLVLVMY